MRRYAASATIGTILAFAACTVMNDLHLPRGTTPSGAGDAGCVLVHPPARPAGPGGGDPANDIVFALRAISEAPSIGYDLDGTCTCHPGPESCTPFDAGRLEENLPHCDGDGGRDLGTSELVAKSAVFDVVSYVNERIAKGLVGLVVLVEDYNGGTNDDQVTVSAFGSGGPDRADGGARPPDFGGLDSWSINRLHVEPEAPAAPPAGRSIFRASGYVASDTLVVTMDLPFAIATGTSTIFEKAVFTGTIVRSGGKPSIGSGIVSARWPVEDLVASVGATDFLGTNGQPFCKSSDTFEGLMRDTICPLLDLTRSKEQDGKGAACDALSINLGFASVPARFGGVTDLDAVNTVCDRTFRCTPR